MTHTLTVSSQGQVVIPSAIRKKMGINPGSKLTLSLNIKGKMPKVILEPQPESWANQATGLGKGLWSDDA